MSTETEMKKNHNSFKQIVNCLYILFISIQYNIEYTYKHNIHITLDSFTVYIIYHDD